MTNEEAVNELKAMKEHIEPYMSVVGSTAYDMAIKALEQTKLKPCEGAISREEVIKLLEKEDCIRKSPCDDCVYTDIADWKEIADTGRVEPVLWCEKYRKLCSDVTDCKYKAESEDKE